MKVLVTTNQFRVGGRETFLGTYVEALRAQGMNAALLSSTVEAGAPGLEAFDGVVACGAGAYASRWAAWLDHGGQLVASSRPDVIWAHHFDLFPAWLLSRVHRIPLLTTFHGPLIGDVRPNDLMQSLGITLAIHRGEGVTAVSDESRAAVESLGRNAQHTWLLPNTVSVPEHAQPPQLPLRRFVLLTRREKLEHIRQSVLLFALYARRVCGCSLVVADGDRSFPSALKGTIRGALRQLGAKWVLSRKSTVTRVLPRVDFIGATSDPETMVRDADVVLGMGRVVLEALAERRPAVLVGYDALHGIVTPSNFDALRRTNFSGRGAPARSLEEITSQLLALNQDGVPDLSSRIADFAVSTWSPTLVDIVRTMVDTSAAPDDAEVAVHVADAIRRGAGEGEIFAIVAGGMSAAELATLYRVSAG